LTEELKSLVNNALATRHPMLLAHVDESGQPVLSFRGSTQVFGDDQFAIWVRNSGGGLVRSIAKNPKVALMYRDEDKKTTFQFQGRARIADGDHERQQVYKASHKVEQDHDFAEVGVALIIDLDRIEGYLSLSPAGQVGRVNMRRTAR
jgi:predicted pyridoxine 5'-phosphate oxidase superfamily flavin-nucleotide-binding protein